jgi:hypothetical protein
VAIGADTTTHLLSAAAELVAAMLKSQVMSQVTAKIMPATEVLSTTITLRMQRPV